MSERLTGRILHQTDPGFDGARRGFGARFDYEAGTPRAVVFAQTVQDVQRAVRWAREHKVPVRARSGRHSYEGYSSLVKDGLVIDLSELEWVANGSKPGRVHVGAGIDMLELTEKLGEMGLGLPLATGPSVGLGGLTQGGGFGITSRRYGLVCDRVVEIQVVNAEGEVMRVNRDHHSDLFWALRGGGGGNFGIVTEFVFDAYPIGNVAIFNITWDWKDFVAVVDKWQNWSFNAPVAFTSLLTLHVDGTVRVEGQYTPDAEDLGKLDEYLAPLLTGPNPTKTDIVPALPYVIAARVTFGVDPEKPEWMIQQHSDNQLFKSTSAVALKPFPIEAIQIMKEGLENYPPLHAPPSQASMLQLLGGGGKSAEPAKDATAVYHRKAMTVVQYDGYWTAPEDGQPTIDWVVELRRKLLPWANGAYVNYHDSQLGPDWLEQYYGGNLKRLREVKRRYDPDNFFRFEQSIPPA